MTRRRRVVLVAVVIAAVALAGLAASRLGTAGSESSPYRLPWQAGQVHTVVQGAVVTDPINGTCTSGCITHDEQAMRFAWDFDLPEGTEVLAARGGTVAFVNGSWRPDHCGGSCRSLVAAGYLSARLSAMRPTSSLSITATGHPRCTCI